MTSSDLVGTVLAGRYRIVRLLGEGAMGAVYLGEHVKIGRQDAIKVLRDSLATDREATQRFLRGARTVSSIRHPNVCTIYDFSDTADGLQFLAMEFVEGETLKELLDREPRLPVVRAVAIATQVALALDAAHEAGVVHRDLKPGNIMLVRGRDGHDVVKVVDFDIAKGPDADGEEVTRLGFVVGTPEYMSPEQLMGESLDGRSDVYSLALVLYRMLAGALPFQAETTQDVMIQRLTHAPMRLADAYPAGAFPERLQQVLDRALDRRASERPDAATFGRDIAHAIASAPAAARGASTAGAAELPATRISPAPPAGSASTPATGRSATRRYVAIAAGIAVVAILGATAVLRGGSRASPGDVNRADTGPDADLPAQPADDPAEPVPQPPAPEPDTRPTQPPVAADTPRPRPDEPASTPSVYIDPALANGVLFRQLDRFPPVADAAPTAAALVAILDTAHAVWQMRGVAPSDRALAAYVMGEAHNARRDWPLCVQWLDSALVLDPANAGYSAMRTNCRGQLR